MKEIPLSKGFVALVDDADFEWLNQWSWYANGSGKLYAVRMPYRERQVRMHRLIVNAPDGMFVDHINGNTLDNRRANLRVCTVGENNRNKLFSSSSTGYKGVRFDKRTGKYTARITLRRKETYLGSFVLAEDAARAYDMAASKYHGEFASLNFPEKG